MLRKEEEVNATVTWEDQQKINSFSWLNNRMRELQADVETLKEDILKIDDASTEIMLSTDDVPALYRIGEVFVPMEADEADERLQKDKEELEVQQEKLEREIEDIKKEMQKLKVHLYGKFKNTINLEDS